MEREELKATFPALYQAVYDTGGWWRASEDCHGCPFISKTASREPGHGPEEYISCDLQGKRTWSDTPSCTEKMWQDKARVELDAVGKRLPVIG